MMKIRFLGAAGNVTGSRYMVETDRARVLVDCGVYQERQYASRNWDPFPVPPSSLDAVLLTHAHLDHCGLLPKLVREGFRGPIYSTGATADIAEIILLDFAHLQEEDADFKRRRHEREGRRGPYPEMPLYTQEDVEVCCQHFRGVRYGETLQAAPGVRATFRNAGHMLGSATIRLELEDGAASRSIVFSGDLGRWEKPILKDPDSLGQADYILMESTYGDRKHGTPGDATDQLAEVVNSTLAAGGNIIVPSFALERAQEVLYCLNELLLERRIPGLKVFLDSPMAVKITEVFEQHPDLYDAEMSRLVRGNHSPFDFPSLTLVNTKEESKQVNAVDSGAMIIAGSGMATGGRIKHHLAKHISRPESTVLFVGYQAVGTLGRLILDGKEEVRILGKWYPVRARIESITGFSGHADREELLAWLQGAGQAPRQVFVVHGEPEAAAAFAALVQERTGWPAITPSYQQEIVLE